MAGEKEPERPPGPARRRPPSVKDVAQAAGVSWKTVSNVIHDHPRVLPETRRRVEEAIEQLGYRASLAGRQLRQGRTGIIALAVPSISAPYFAELAHKIINVARSHNLTVLIDETGGSVDHERTVARGFDIRFSDGIIFSPHALAGADVQQVITTTPIVLLGERAGEHLDHVGIDNVDSATTLTGHLLGTGRRHLAFVGAQYASARQSTGSLRLSGHLAALRDAGIAPNPDLIFETREYSRAEGARLVRDSVALLRDCDGIVCANDLLAIGTMRALRENGIAVPADIAVAGWDDIDEGGYVTPALTTIAPDTDRIARLAVETLVRRINGDQTPYRHHIVDHALKVRGSTAKPPVT